MQAPLCLTFRHVEYSPALAARVSELADRLDRIHDRIIRCEVLIAAPADPCNGEAPGVSVEITIPGGVINARSAPSARPQDVDVFVALDVAFDNVAGQLQDEALTHYCRKPASSLGQAAS
jgi:ribosome-associated translation inhibitor RaiA